MFWCTLYYRYGKDDKGVVLLSILSIAPPTDLGLHGC